MDYYYSYLHRPEKVEYVHILYTMHLNNIRIYSCFFNYFMQTAKKHVLNIMFETAKFYFLNF